MRWLYNLIRSKKQDVGGENRKSGMRCAHGQQRNCGAERAMKNRVKEAGAVKAATSETVEVQ
jgi:hypothetical protein